MEVKFNLNIKLILTILLILGLILSNVLLWRAEVESRKIIIGVVNYLNKQIQSQQQQIPQPSKEKKEERK